MTELQHAVDALMSSPLARQPLEAAEAAPHAGRRGFLEQIAAAEHAQSAALAEALKPLPELRAALAEAQAWLHDAAVALHHAECRSTYIQCGADARATSLRRQLGPLRDAAIESTRLLLLIERRAAETADDYKAVREPLRTGGTAHHTIHVDRGGAARLRQVSEALAELAAMERDRARSPAAIEARCTAIRAGIAAGPAPGPNAERTHPENILRSTPLAIVQRAVRKYLHR